MLRRLSRHISVHRPVSKLNFARQDNGTFSGVLDTLHQIERDRFVEKVRTSQAKRMYTGGRNMIIGFVRFFFPNVAYRRAAKRHLLQHFPENPEQVWRSTLDWQLRLASSRPRHSASVNIMIRYMEWSLALYRAAKDHGMSQTRACSLAENILSEIYQPVPATMFKFSRVRSGNHETRVKWLFGMVTRYFFSAPFQHRHLESRNGVAFDVTCCPEG